jgi:hypothetical protein
MTLEWPPSVRLISSDPRRPRTLFLAASEEGDLSLFRTAVLAFVNMEAGGPESGRWSELADARRVPLLSLPLEGPRRAESSLGGASRPQGLSAPDIVLGDGRPASVLERTWVLDSAQGPLARSLIRQRTTAWAGKPLPAREAAQVWAVDYKVNVASRACFSRKCN